MKGLQILIILLHIQRHFNVIQHEFHQLLN